PKSMRRKIVCGAVNHTSELNTRVSQTMRTIVRPPNILAAQSGLARHDNEHGEREADCVRSAGGCCHCGRLGRETLGLANKYLPQKHAKAIGFDRLPETKPHALQRADVFSLPALGSLGHFEFNRLAFLQTAKATALNRGKMDENILA